MTAGAGPALVVLLVALVSVGPLTTDLYLPSLPNMARAFHAAPAEAKLTLSLYMAAFGCAQLVYGPLSDRLGRRPVLLVGLGLYVLASAACALAATVGALVALRIVQAFGACSATVIGRAVVRDLFAGARAVQVLAAIGAAMALAPVLGPLAGGVLEEAFGWRAAFVTLTVVGAGLLATVAAALAETNVRRGPHVGGASALVRGYLVLLRSRSYLGFVVGIAFTFAGLFLFISESSFVMIDHLGLSPSAYGVSFAAVAAGYMIGNIVSARLSRRHPPQAMVRAGAGLCAGAGAAMCALALGGVAHLAAVIAPMSAYMIGVGLVMPNGIAGALMPVPERAGAASALLGFTQMVFAALIAWAVSLLPAAGALPLAVGTAALGALALATFITLVPAAPRQ